MVQCGMVKCGMVQCVAVQCIAVRYGAEGRINILKNAYLHPNSLTDAFYCVFWCIDETQKVSA